MEAGVVADKAAMFSEYVTIKSLDIFFFISVGSWWNSLEFVNVLRIYVVWIRNLQQVHL